MTSIDIESALAWALAVLVLIGPGLVMMKATPSHAPRRGYNSRS